MKWDDGADSIYKQFDGHPAKLGPIGPDTVWVAQGWKGHERLVAQTREPGDFPLGPVNPTINRFGFEVLPPIVFAVVGSALIYLALSQGSKKRRK